MLLPSKNKRVGFLGNMNNYPFMLALQLKENGYEITFILTETEKLCRPEYKYPVSIPYPEWIHDFSPMDLDFFTGVEKRENFKEIVGLLSQCDFIVLNGYAVRFKEFFRPKHFCILTGSDLISLADYGLAEKLYKDWTDQLIKSDRISENAAALKLVNNAAFFKMAYLFFPLLTFNPANRWFAPKNFLFNLFHLSVYKMALYEEINKQRRSIKSACGFVHAPKGLVEDSDKMFKSIGVDEANRVPGLMADTALSGYTPMPDNNTVRIFNVARFNWVKDKELTHFSQLDYKGNDIMIKGIALFYHKHQTPLDIVFVRKGENVTESEALSKQLKIDHLITWREVLSQKEVQEEYEKADIVFDQLSQSIVSMGGLDAMAVGRPLIANARSEIFDSILGEQTEICDAQTEQEVCAWLEKLVPDRNYRIQKGRLSREFVLKHFSGQSVVNRIEKNLERCPQ